MRQWPVKILLVHPKAPFLQDEKLTIAADCAILVDKKLTEKFGKEPIIIGCPMLEDPKRIFEKLKMILDEGSARNIEVYTMEVPCCHAIHMMVDRIVKEDMEIKKYIVRVSGETEPYSGVIDEKMKEAEMKAHRGM